MLPFLFLCGECSATSHYLKQRWCFIIYQPSNKLLCKLLFKIHTFSLKKTAKKSVILGYDTTCYGNTWWLVTCPIWHQAITWSNYNLSSGRLLGACSHRLPVYTDLKLNSLVSRRCVRDSKSVISEHMLRLKFMNTFCKIVLMWMP